MGAGPTVKEEHWLLHYFEFSGEEHH